MGFFPIDCKSRFIMDVGLRFLPAQARLDKILDAQRRRIFDAFMAFSQGAGGDTVLEVGAGSTLLNRESGCLLPWADPGLRKRIVSSAVELPDRGGGRRHRPGDSGKYQRDDGRYLAFSDGEFDWVFCSGVIEHMGSFERRGDLLKELNRVARKGVFVAARNRWHPLEFDGGLPLLHWLPASWRRRMLTWPGADAWAAGAALDLLDAASFQKLASRLPGQPDCSLLAIRLLGVNAHWCLRIRKAVGSG
jgi:hypothetical protein